MASAGTASVESASKQANSVVVHRRVPLTVIDYAAFSQLRDAPCDVLPEMHPELVRCRTRGSSSKISSELLEQENDLVASDTGAARPEFASKGDSTRAAAEPRGGGFELEPGEELLPEEECTRRTIFEILNKAVPGISIQRLLCWVDELEFHESASLIAAIDAVLDHVYAAQPLGVTTTCLYAQLAAVCLRRICVVAPGLASAANPARRISSQQLCAHFCMERFLEILDEPYPEASRRSRVFVNFLSQLYVKAGVLDSHFIHVVLTLLLYDDGAQHAQIGGDDNCDPARDSVLERRLETWLASVLLAQVGSALAAETADSRAALARYREQLHQPV